MAFLIKRQSKREDRPFRHACLPARDLNRTKGLENLVVDCSFLVEFVLVGALDTEINSLLLYFGYKKIPEFFFFL